MVGEDELLDWTNPVSNKSYKVNARTGNTVGVKRPVSAGSCLASGKRVRIVDSQDGKPGEWVENLLKVFTPPLY
jgi:hypothetical protein